MGKNKYRHKVQYYETDQMGVVHHSNYIRWFEEARTDYMEQMGMGYAGMEAAGFISPVLEAHASYLRMVRFGDVVTIVTNIKEYNGIRMTVGYQVMDNASGRTMCTGETKHCFLGQNGNPVSLKREAIEYHQMLRKGLEDYKNSKLRPEELEAKEEKKIEEKDYDSL